MYDINLIRKISRLRIFFIVFAILFLQSFSNAQNSDSAPTQLPTTTVINKTPKKQVLNFEDELVEGGSQKPELFYLFQKKNFNYTRLIKLRENFLPEMRKTSEEIQRQRGGR